MVAVEVAEVWVEVLLQFGVMVTSGCSLGEGCGKSWLESLGTWEISTASMIGTRGLEVASEDFFFAAGLTSLLLFTLFGFALLFVVVEGLFGKQLGQM